MGKRRDRENPCGICGHYHKYEEGEPCGVCGHTLASDSASMAFHVSDFATEILPRFLYLGTYHNAVNRQRLTVQGISHILNTVPGSKNMNIHLFTHHSLQEVDKRLPFDDAIQFIEQCQNNNGRVLVHCMSGKSRSPAIVMAYLMKSKGWKLVDSYQWVKERRPSVELSQAVREQLLEYEQHVFGSTDNSSNATPSLPSTPFSFGFSQPNGQPAVPVPAFNYGGSSIFSHSPVDIPQEFTFGAGQTQKHASD